MCLHMVAKYHSKNYSIQNLREKTQVNRARVSSLGIVEAAVVCATVVICPITSPSRGYPTRVSFNITEKLIGLLLTKSLS